MAHIKCENCTEEPSIVTTYKTFILKKEEEVTCGFWCSFWWIFLLLFLSLFFVIGCLKISKMPNNHSDDEERNGADL